MSVKKSISLILAFILSVLIAVISVVVIVKVTFLDESFLRKQITASQYSENLIKDLEKSFTSYGIVSGFDSEFFKQVLQSDAVKTDIYHEVSFLYGSGTKRASKKEFSEKLSDIIIKDVQARGFEVDESVKAALIYLSDTCTEDYMSSIEIPFMSSAKEIITKLNNLTAYAISLLVILIFVVVLIIYFLNSWKRRKLRYYIYSVAGAFLMLFIPAIFVSSSNKIELIGISSRASYYLLVNYLRDVLGMFFFFAAVLGVIWVLLVLFRLWVCSNDNVSEKRKVYNGS